VPCSCILSWLTFQRCVLPPSSGQCDTPQKTLNFILATVRSWTLTRKIFIPRARMNPPLATVYWFQLVTENSVSYRSADPCKCHKRTSPVVPSFLEEVYSSTWRSVGTFSSCSMSMQEKLKISILCTHTKVSLWFILFDFIFEVVFYCILTCWWLAEEIVFDVMLIIQSSCSSVIKFFVMQSCTTY
jgi:hypothetical protein